MNIRKMIYDVNNKKLTPLEKALYHGMVRYANIDDYDLEYIVESNNYGCEVRHYIIATSNNVCNPEYSRLEAAVIYNRDYRMFDQTYDTLDDLRAKIKWHINTKEILVYK